MAKPITAGEGRVYSKTIEGRRFECEQFPDGNWLLFAIIIDKAGTEKREFWNDFTTKRGAWAAVAKGLQEEKLSGMPHPNTDPDNG